jgi:hypothetical protein
VISVIYRPSLLAPLELGVEQLIASAEPPRRSVVGPGRLEPDALRVRLDA